ncbi:MAG TPA: penicillin-binding transpeptidase domain-containing protein, partial [Spirochaetota bacterium]|nr:penicillin-binding transpeptidase domain-containing protein [Spirochaetota bacterium]
MALKTIYLGLALLSISASLSASGFSTDQEAEVRRAVHLMDRKLPHPERRILLAVNIPASRLIAHTGGQKAWRNRFSPGSLAKIPLVWHLMTEGRLSQDYTWRCTRKFFPGGEGTGCDELIHEDIEYPARGQYYKCSLLKGHGVVSLEQALSVSCNHAFLNLHDRLSPDKWDRFCRSSGLLGRNSLLELDPQAEPGMLDAPCCPRDRLLLPVGFGLHVTPGAMAVFFTSLFSGGSVRTIVPAQSSRSGTPIGTLPLPTAVRNTILGGMRKAAHHGTARSLAIPGASILAKTGSGLI